MMNIAHRMRDELASLLECSPESLSMEKTFYELGVDSLLGIRLIGKLNDVIGHEIDPVVLFDHPSIYSLAQYIEANRRPATAQG